MADRLALAFALALVTAPPVLAQSPEAPTTPRYEIGVETSPLFKAFLDTNGRFPPVGGSRFGLAGSGSSSTTSATCGASPCTTRRTTAPTRRRSAPSCPRVPPVTLPGAR